MMAAQRSIFVDASALVAMIDEESDWRTLLSTLDKADTRLTSPLAIWETVNAIERLRACDFDEAAAAVKSFLDAMRISTVGVTAQMGEEALRAAGLFGKGRHPARLNFGDCFAYACARTLGVPLLFKGDDFARTDIEPA